MTESDPRETTTHADDSWSGEPQGSTSWGQPTASGTSPDWSAERSSYAPDSPRWGVTHPDPQAPGATGAGGAGDDPWWQQSGPAAAPAAPRRRRPIGLVAGVAALAIALGGGAGAITSALLSDDATTRTVVQSTPGGSSQVAPPAAATGSTTAVARKVLPGVVQIQEQSTDGSGGTGSGIILRSSGYILTNNHVVEGAADGGRLQVTLNDGRKTAAMIVGRDVGADLAVVKVNGVSGLTPVALGTSADLQVGQPVVAVGSPLGLAGTVTEGIVSSLNRPVTTSEQGGGSDSTILNAIQTDSAINPGNSGGALVDMSGRLIGINSAIASLGSSSGTQSGSIGLGFAIPVDQAKRIANLLISTGSSNRALLGASLGTATDGGAQVQSVTGGGAAEKAGLRQGDVITKFGSQLIDDSTAAIAAVRSAVPGSSVTLTYTRGGQTATAQVTLGSIKS